MIKHVDMIGTRNMAQLASTNDGATYIFEGLTEEKAKHFEPTLIASPIFHTIFENRIYEALPCIDTYGEGMVV